MTDTTIERPPIYIAAQHFSGIVIGQVWPGWNEIALIVSARIEPPKNFMGWPVKWKKRA